MAETKPRKSEHSERVNVHELERQLLAVAGLEETELTTYEGKINVLQERFRKYASEREKNVGSILENVHRSKLLFDFLWQEQENRYNGNFLLPEVLDSQIEGNSEVKVGNCLGLTSLYTVLGLREGLELYLLINQEHILNLLKDKGISVTIENTSRDGFAKEIPVDEFKLRNPIYLVDLVENSINHRISDSIREENHRKAISYLTIKLTRHPDSIDARLKRAQTYAKLGDKTNATKDAEEVYDGTRDSDLYFALKTAKDFSLLERDELIQTAQKVIRPAMELLKHPRQGISFNSYIRAPDIAQEFSFPKEEIIEIAKWSLRRILSDRIVEIPYNEKSVAIIYSLANKYGISREDVVTIANEAVEGYNQPFDGAYRYAIQDLILDRNIRRSSIFTK